MLLVLAMATPVAAQGPSDVPPTIPPGDDVIIVLEAGQVAPWTGQFFNQDTAVRWLTTRRWYRIHVEELRVQHSVELELVRSNYELRLRLVSESYERQVAALESSLAEASNPPFWRRASFGLVLGVVLTAVAVIAASVTN